jgi:hypothetical protein
MAIRKSSMSGTPKGATTDRPASPSIGDTFNNGTLGIEEIYTGPTTGWVAKSATPAIPYDAVATNQPSGRSYDNGRMSIAFSSGSGGGLVSEYVVTPSPATTPSTFIGSSSPITVTNLSSNQQYTFTVQARNNFGTSLSSTASSSVTSTTVPQAPVIGTASVGGSPYTSATVTWSAVTNNGGSAITGYIVVPYLGNTAQTPVSVGSGSTSTVITNLTANAQYTFKVKATNANGDSAESSATNIVSMENPLIVSAVGGYGNSGNNGGAGGSGGGSAAGSDGTGGGRGGYNGSNGENGGRNNQGTGQLSLAYGSGTNPYIPTGGAGTSSTTPAYAGLGPNNYGSGLSTVFNQVNSSTRVSGYGRGCGGSEGGWSSVGSAGQDGLVAWTNSLGSHGVISDSTSSWPVPATATYTFYVTGGGGGGGGGYYGPGGSGYYATATKALTLGQSLVVTIGAGGSQGARFGNGGRGGTTTVSLP